MLPLSALRSGCATGTKVDLRTVSRLLLREAVRAAEADHQLAGRNSRDAPAREALGEQVERARVARRAEARHHDAVVRDVEVRVARGKPHAAVLERRGEREIEHFERAAARVACAREGVAA